MNFRGGLAYYPAAVACGSFFLALAYYPYLLLTSGASREHVVRDFLFTFFFTTILAAFDLLLTAFLLRIAARRMRLTRAWSWVIAGVGVYAGLTAMLGGLGSLIERGHSADWIRVPVLFLLMGPRFALSKPLWLSIAPVVASCYVLFLVHRAFEPRMESPQV